MTHCINSPASLKKDSIFELINSHRIREEQLKLSVTVSSLNTYNATNVITSVNEGKFASCHQETLKKKIGFV